MGTWSQETLTTSSQMPRLGEDSCEISPQQADDCSDGKAMLPKGLHKKFCVCLSVLASNRNLEDAFFRNISPGSPSRQHSADPSKFPTNISKTFTNPLEVTGIDSHSHSTWWADCATALRSPSPLRAWRVMYISDWRRANKCCWRAHTWLWSPHARCSPHSLDKESREGASGTGWLRTKPKGMHQELVSLASCRAWGMGRGKVACSRRGGGGDWAEPGIGSPRCCWWWQCLHGARRPSPSFPRPAGSSLARGCRSGRRRCIRQLCPRGRGRAAVTEGTAWELLLFPGRERRAGAHTYERTAVPTHIRTPGLEGVRNKPAARCQLWGRPGPAMPSADPSVP